MEWCLTDVILNCIGLNLSKAVKCRVTYLDVSRLIIENNDNQASSG